MPPSLPQSNFLTMSHQTEAAGAVQGNTGLVFGQDHRLERPQTGPLRVVGQLVEQRPANALPARGGGHIHADLGHPGVRLPPGDGAERRPAQNNTLPDRDQTADLQMTPIPVCPGRDAGFQAGNAGVDALLEDGTDGGPVPIVHRADGDGH